MMKTGIRIAACAAMLSAALALSTFTLGGFTVREGGGEERQSLYLLGEAEGQVAVYHRDDPDRPMLLTGIPLDSLRERDRELIAAGLPVESREELALLLEDLGD